MTEKDALQRYLLGDTDEDERAALEEKYFADDELFEELLETETDLVDAYVDGTLTPEERKRFEERFMSTTEGSERVEFARTLRRRMTAKGVSNRQPWWLAVAASFTIVGFATAWLIFVPDRPEKRPRVASRPPAVQPAITATAAPESPEPAAPVSTESALLTLVLTPGGTREGEAAPPLILRTAPQWVQLDLVLENDRYDSYNAELQDVEGRVLWTGKSLRAGDGSVKPRVPAKLLPPGDYVVVLYGVRSGAPVEINNYTFTVTALPRKQ